MLLCRISCELAGCVHQPIVGSGQTNLSHLYFSLLSLTMPAKLNFFKTPTSVRLVQVGPCPLPLEYQAATSHTGRQPCRVKSLYMKRFCSVRNKSMLLTSKLLNFRLCNSKESPLKVLALNSYSLKMILLLGTPSCLGCHCQQLL